MRGKLQAASNLNSVGLLNDMEAYAYGIDASSPRIFITLSEGSEDAEGNRAVISAKTGLGMAGLYWDGFRHHPFACEGGHADFAPRDDLQMELLRICRRNTAASVVSEFSPGPGSRIFTTFCAMRTKPKSRSGYGPR